MCPGQSIYILFSLLCSRKRTLLKYGSLSKILNIYSIYTGRTGVWWAKFRNFIFFRRFVDCFWRREARAAAGRPTSVCFCEKPVIVFVAEKKKKMSCIFFFTLFTFFFTFFLFFSFFQPFFFRLIVVLICVNQVRRCVRKREASNLGPAISEPAVHEDRGALQNRKCLNDTGLISIIRLLRLCERAFFVFVC